MQVQRDDFFWIRRHTDEPEEQAFVKDVSVTLDNNKLANCYVLLEIGTDNAEWFDIAQLVKWGLRPKYT